MPRFRPPPAHPASAVPLTPLAVAELVDEVTRPGQFFVRPPLRLSWAPARRETIPWELFRGTLLDATKTRATHSFLSWNIREDSEAAEPLLSVKYDVRAGELHITRGILCHAWEGYDSGGGVMLSRETTRWQHERVGTIVLARFTDADTLRDELIAQLWLAVVGTSRLPLTSLEAPLPAFVLGQLAYVYRPDATGVPMTDVRTLIEHGLQLAFAWRETVKLLETILRASTRAEIPEICELFLARRQQLGLPSTDLPRLLRALFNDVSLSPDTGFIDTALAWVDELERRAALSHVEHADLLTFLLRQLSRHLAAYDLVVFHHRGANYPDALLLDAVLTRVLDLCEHAPDLFMTATPAARLRRRGLRQGCLVRRQYEKHLVPEAPTSPGENARVMPAAFPRVPEEQLLQPLRRPRQLFADAPLAGLLGPGARQVLAQSLADLDDEAEAIELGIAVFIDRPLGYGKLVGEPDQTPLLAHEAFSPTLAQRRRAALVRLAQELHLGGPIPVREVSVTGLSHTLLATPARPTAALADVRRVADDFIIVRTLPGGLDDFRAVCDLPALDVGTPRLLVAVADRAGPTLQLFDEELRLCVAVVPDMTDGWNHRAGFEFPTAGLREKAIDEPRPSESGGLSLV